jgi:serine/threonine protein kinase
MSAPVAVTATNAEAGAGSLAAAMDELRRLPRAQWLDLARSDQSHRWRQGISVPVEEYFDYLPEIRGNLEEAVVLICGEVQLRREQGEAPTVDEYARRFPQFADRLSMQFHVDEFLAAPLAAGDDDQGDELFAIELPGYEILERLGSGAGGVVYRARQSGLGRFVAIKAMALAGADARQLARQRQEAEILARLHHPNVVHVYEVREYGGRLHLVMEYVEGTTLAGRTREQLLAPDESARLALTLAETVQAVHEAGVLHRDLKPSNVLVTPKGELKITDFGLAKLQSGENLLTTADSVLGTPSYMAPEQAFGGATPVGPTADVYSLGAILYELLTGRAPFLGATVLDTLSLIRTAEPAPPRHLQPKLPRDLETICLHALEKSPEGRYASAGALADDLRRFLDRAPIQARRWTAVERLSRWSRRNPVVASLTAIAAALLVAAVTILMVSNSRIRRESAAKGAALATARQAVDQMLMRVASDKLSTVALAHPLREALLRDALSFYESLLAETPDDASLRTDMADALWSMGFVQRELGRFDDAIRSYERSIGLLKQNVDEDPRPRAMREKLAATHEALAFTWSINRTPAGRRRADREFRLTLQLYEELERNWPAHRQPAGLCLRHLANSAFKRGSTETAERLWRQAIVRGEAYLEQRPDNSEARSGLCWASAEFCDAILLRSEKRTAEAERLLKNGLEHSAVMLRKAPDSPPARDVRAFLQFCLARCYLSAGRTGEAVELFQQANQGIEALAAEFPWNQQYWDSVNYFHRETARGLQDAGRADDVRAALRDMAEWLQAVGPELPSDAVAQAELRRCRRILVQLLREAGQPRLARELQRGTSDQRAPAG